MKQFMASVKFTFSGKVIVNAENEEQAKRILDEQLGLVLGGNIECQSEETIPEFYFNTHAEKEVESVDPLEPVDLSF